MLVFEKEKLERLQFVIEDGKHQVTKRFRGTEAIVTMALMMNRNRSVRMTDKEICRVFGEDGTYRGYIKMENFIPKKYPESTGEVFSDYYEEVK